MLWGPWDQPCVQWFSRMIHRIQHIVVLMAKIYYSERIYDRIIRGNRHGCSLEKFHIIPLLCGTHQACSFLQQNVQCSCPENPLKTRCPRLLLVAITKTSSIWTLPKSQTLGRLGGAQDKSHYQSASLVRNSWNAKSPDHQECKDNIQKGSFKSGSPSCCVYHQMPAGQASPSRVQALLVVVWMPSALLNKLWLLPNSLPRFYCQHRSSSWSLQPEHWVFLSLSWDEQASWLSNLKRNSAHLLHK